MAGVVLALLALLIYLFSGRPSYAFFHDDESLLVVSLRYTAALRRCRERGPEELERLPEHMRTPLDLRGIGSSVFGRWARLVNLLKHPGA